MHHRTQRHWESIPSSQASCGRIVDRKLVCDPSLGIRNYIDTSSLTAHTAHRLRGIRTDKWRTVDSCSQLVIKIDRRNR
jgi:hypothetical protein